MGEPANPLSDPQRFERRVPECAMVIFGANGDLTKRKLLPALYQLAADRRLPESFTVIGNSRTEMSDDAFREKMLECVKEDRGTDFDPGLWTHFGAGLHYVAGDLHDAGMYGQLRERLEAGRRHNVLFYLSTQPSHYAPVAGSLGAAGLARDDAHGWRRLIVEKPFGRDLASAHELNSCLQQVFHESDLYRIDHYLGKETVQNILAFRFGNAIFEPLWNRRYVNHVQITAAESIGVEGRGAFYQETGALRDMIQNHLLQVLATIAMEPPAVFEPGAVRDERAKLLRSVRVMRPEDVSKYAVAGQYNGFAAEPGVRPGAQTDTYAAVTFFIDNWRWAGVPFFVRTGKKLPKRFTDIAIQYNMPPLSLFGANTGEPAARPNLLIVRIQPEEGISLRFLSKEPRTGMRLRPVSMDFDYSTSFGKHSRPAYETLLIDAMLGDATLYTRQDMVEASWRVIQPILDAWGDPAFRVPRYEPGAWGPAEADRMLATLGRSWRNG